MATTSEIKAGLDDIANSIRSSRVNIRDARTAISAARQSLQDLPTNFSDLVATVQAFDPATTDVFEQNAIADLASLTAEFQQLVSDAQSAESALVGV